MRLNDSNLLDDIDLKNQMQNDNLLSDCRNPNDFFNINLQSQKKMNDELGQTNTIDLGISQEEYRRESFISNSIQDLDKE